MKSKEDKQPGVEGSAAKEVTEGVSGESMDAAPAENKSAAVGAAPQDEAEKAVESVKHFLEHSAEKAEEEGLITHAEYLDRLKEFSSPEAKLSLGDELKAVIEKAAKQYGVPHLGDHESTAKTLAAMFGHITEDLVSLVGKLRQHVGL